MPERLNPADLEAELQTRDEAVLQRRRFLRGGALLAAAAGGAVAATASAAMPASAADGEAVKVGGKYVGGAPTSFQTSGALVPALVLGNDKGPALQLTPRDDTSPWDDALPVGALVSTGVGPFVGVSDERGGSYTTYLATGDDLDTCAVTAPVTPVRVWDSKAKTGTVLARSSTTALDSRGRLQKGQWVDVKVAASTLASTPTGAFLTVGSSGSKKDGFLSAYKPGSRPGTVSLSFLKGKTMSGSAFPGLGHVSRAFAVRVYASQTTYVTLDLSALTSFGYPGPDATTGARSVTAARTTVAARTSATTRARQARRG